LHTLYIVGAGCSKNYSDGETDVPGLESPLDSDFFKMAKKVISNKGVEPELEDSLNLFLDRLYEIYESPPPFERTEPFSIRNGHDLAIFDDDRLSLESIMTMLNLESDIFTKPWSMFGYDEGGNGSLNDLALGGLVELIAVTIAEALRGQPCSKHRRLADLMQANDIVFSYNYDILMDNALRQCKKLTDKGYLLDFFKVFNGIDWEEPENGISEVTILKLHGSLNWIRCSYCGSTFLLRFQKAGAWTTFPKECPRCKRREFLRRLLIPPLLNKNYADRDMNFLWLEARRLLQVVRKIVIIGYSLPPTDFASETLLSTGFPWGIRRNIPVIIVNPDRKKNLKEHFSKIFSPGKITMIENLEDFLR